MTRQKVSPAERAQAEYEQRGRMLAKARKRHTETETAYQDATSDLAAAQARYDHAAANPDLPRQEN